MPTTPKSALRYPVLSDTGNPPRDLGYLASDLDGRIVTACTSATRPAAPATGQPIFETDTKFSNVYNGTRWQRVADTEVGSQVVSTNPTLGIVMGTIATANVVTLGGALRVTGSALLNNATSGSDRTTAMQITLDGVAQTPLLSTIDVRLGASVSSPASFVWEIAAAAGAHTVLLQAFASTSSAVTVPAASIVVVEKP